MYSNEKTELLAGDCALGQRWFAKEGNQFIFIFKKLVSGLYLLTEM